MAKTTDNDTAQTAEKPADQHLSALQRGLKALGRERRVVLSHHHTFELIEELQEHLEQLRPHCGTSSTDKTSKPK